jgi:hypothetical protein
MTNRQPNLDAIAALAAAMVFVAAPGFGQATDGPALRSHEVTRLVDDGPTPTIDGRVEETVWSLAKPMTGFTQQEPIEGGTPSERTEVRVLIDRRNVYIGIICFDSDPSEIVVTQSRRDGALNDTDSVQIILDTFDDNQNGFVFGTNPLGLEYDGQVANEGQGGGGGPRGGGGFNVNWDADWSVRGQITQRGWETELAIPLKTLRYATGRNRRWGFNVQRMIRRRNEIVFLAAIPRGYNLYRVSRAAKLTGLDLTTRRDVKVTPFVLGSANQDYTVAADSLDTTADVGLDVKWGVKPNLTADFTLNTDFAQVEADEEQVNLTRFPLFFPEKRGFFLENSATFQFGTPRSVDLFFSRRIGLDRTGVPIDIVAGGRLSGKIGSYNVGLLNIQTRPETDTRRNALLAPGNNFSVARIQREVGRSNFGAIFVGRMATGATAAAGGDVNRAYGVDANLQVSSNAKLFSYLARTDSPGADGSDYAGRVLYQYQNNLWTASAGYTQVGERFNPEVGFLPRRGYRQPEAALIFQPQPQRWPWIRRFRPTFFYNAQYGFDDLVQSSRTHIHPFLIEMADGGQFGFWWEYRQDRPETDFRVFRGPDGRTVTIPPGLYGWLEFNANFVSDPSAPVFYSYQQKYSGFYDGTNRGFVSEVGFRIGAQFITSLAYSRDSVNLPGGAFSTNLVPFRIGYAFTTLASLQALIQYNSQSSTLSSNIRLALLDRSGTGFFFVYNDQRDVSRVTPDTILGRSFIVKYTRLFDF